MFFIKNKYNIPNKVIIWGNDNSNMLGVLRQLSENKIYTFLLFNKQKARIASMSRYCKFYYVASCIDDGLDYIRSNFSQEKHKPILLCTGDLFAEAISAHYDELSLIFHIAGFRQQGAMSRYLDKNVQNSVAKKVGLEVPISGLYDKDSINKDLCGIITYPCIIKPAMHYEHYKEDSHRFKIEVCYTSSQFKKISEILEKDKLYLIQEYIKKDNLVVINGCRHQDGSVFISGSLVCENGGEDCDSSFGYVTEDIPKCIDIKLIERFVQEINYYGPFGFDFGIKDDKAYFFEMNLRIDATNYLFYKMGGQFILSWIFDVAKRDNDLISHVVRGKKYFMDDIGELHQITSRKINRSIWRSHFFKAKIHKFFNWKDLTPFIVQYLIYLVYPLYRNISKH